MASDFAVLVLSCDKYSDVWPAFFRCFRQSFPAGDWPVYVGSNTKVCDEPGVTTLLSGDDPDWSTSYKRILRQIPQAKILVILEDLFASSPTDRALLETALDFVFAYDARHLRYWPGTPIDGPTDHPEIGRFDRGAPYRATVCGFWDRKYLLELLLEGESPWDFEIVGSYRTSYVDGFFGLRRPLFEFVNMIEKGSWMPASVEWARANGIAIDLGRRPLLVGRRQLGSRLKMAFFRLMMRVPWRRRVRWMNALRKALISY